MKRVLGWRSMICDAFVDPAPEQEVERQVVLDGGLADAVEAGIVGGALLFLAQEDADADGARRLLPLRDHVGHVLVVRVDRLDDGHAAGMGARHLLGIAAVVAVHREGRDEDRAVDADLVHRRHHLVAGHVRRPVRHGGPGPLGRVGLVGVDLRIDDRHREPPMPSLPDSRLPVPRDVWKARFPNSKGGTGHARHRHPGRHHRRRHGRARLRGRRGDRRRPHRPGRRQGRSRQARGQGRWPPGDPGLGRCAHAL